MNPEIWSWIKAAAGREGVTCQLRQDGIVLEMRTNIRPERRVLPWAVIEQSRVDPFSLTIENMDQSAAQIAAIRPAE